MFERALGGALSVLTCALWAGCRSEVPSELPAPVTPPAPRVPAPAAAKPPPVWVVSAASLRRHRALAPRADAVPEGAILDGLRVSFPDGRVADDVAEPALVAGSRVPQHLGGGYLFWSATGVYRARSLLARLEPLTSLSAPVRRASFGPGMLLLHLNGGARHAVELPSGRTLRMPRIGLIDVATAGPRAHLALVEPDRLFVGPSASELQPQAQVAVDSLMPGDGEVWLHDASGRAFRLAADGSFGAFDRIPARLRQTQLGDDPRWPVNNETPLERAVRRGVPIGDRLALVDAGGAMAWVNLATGELGELGRRFLPEGSSCRLFPLERDIVATCTSRGGTLFASGLAGPEPKLERSFVSSGPFFFAGTGTVLHASPCSSRPDEAGSLCLRGTDGHWRSLRVPGAGGDGGSPTHVVQRWLPKRDGGALGIVDSPKRGVLELPSGTFTAFSDKAHERITRLMRPSANESLVDDAMLTESGDFQLLDEESVLVRRDGSVESSPHRMSQVASAGSAGMGRDSSGKLWQTRDWGRSWHAVAGPPSSRPEQRSALPRRCSFVGCDFESWYRIGYPIEPDAPRKFAVAPPVPSPKTPPLPRLECAPTAPARVAAVRRSEDSDASDPSFDLGARRVQGARDPARVALTLEDGMTRVALFGANDASGVPRLFAARMVETLSIAPVVRSARPPANLVLPNLFNGDGTALPVLGRTGPDGFIAVVDGGNGELAIWLRADRPPRIAALGESVLVRSSAAQARGDELLLLAGSGDNCAARVMSIGAHGALPLFDLPHRPSNAECSAPDVLGLDPSGGVAVLRFPSGSTPPAADDPALAFRSGAEPVALAPWSALSTADSPACSAPQSEEWRALVVLPGEWLDLALTGVPRTSDELGMIALVRWSPSRVCLEAVELTGAGEVQVGDQGVATVVAARFGAKPEAGRRGIDFGVEYAEPLACKLGAR